MHVYFSGIGGGALCPGALIAKDAGYEVSGSDQYRSQYTDYLEKHDIHAFIGQNGKDLAKLHAEKPVDLFVYTLALPADHPELVFCRQNNIKTAKIYEFLGTLIDEKRLKLIAVAGTHGKTTTTSMMIWLFKALDLPLSYSTGAKISFGEMGVYDSKSEYFVLEADEFGGKFLAYKPYLSVISGISYDHHELYPTQQDYYDAFKQFITQSQETILWHNDAQRLDPAGKILNKSNIFIESENTTYIDDIKLLGRYNRYDAWLAIRAVAHLTQESPEELIKLMNDFPGVSRRFEKLADNLYTDYAHTPDKIRGVMSVALETAQKTGQKIVVIYEPLTNRRMHYLKDQHQDVFDGVDALYWVPSYLAREDPNQPVLTPVELIKHLDAPAMAVAKPAELNNELKEVIKKHLANGDLVVGLSGGGGGSLDEWLRQNFQY